MTHFASTAENTQVFSVYDARDFIASGGLNIGRELGLSDELEISDTYQLRPGAKRRQLSAVLRKDHLEVAKGSPCGNTGAAVYLDCAVTFMATSGETIDGLVLVEIDRDGMIENTYLLSFAPFELEVDHALVSSSTKDLSARLAALGSIAFTRGTQITLSSGKQTRVEDLQIGDKVLTRDNGPQEIRWIGAQTLRATGSMAPIVIHKGVMNNAEDLTLSPNHRIYVYQGKNNTAVDAEEILVKARLLVNGVDVIQTEGGYVEYFQILFDSHEIIFAEGIAVESLLADESVKPSLPSELRKRLFEGGKRTAPVRNVELPEGQLDPSKAAALLAGRAVQ